MTTADKPAALGLRGVLAIRDYKRIAAAQFVSDFGDALTNLAVLLVVNELTGSVAALALMAIVLAVPPLTIGIVAGAWVDRLEPRRIMLVADALRAALVLGLVFVHTADQLWILYALGLAEASVGTFFTPARTTLVSVVVPRNGLMAANSLSQSGRVLAMVLGSAAAGVLVSLTASFWPAFVTDSLTFVVSFVLVLGVKTRLRGADLARAEQETGGSSIVREIRAGLSAVAGSPTLVATVVAACSVMLGVGAVNVLFVPLLINDLNVSPAWFGIIDGAQAVGMVVATVLLSARLALYPTSRVLVTGMLFLAGFTAALAAVGSVWHVVVLLFVAGVIVTPVQASFSTLVQTSAARDVRGRVAALLSSATSGASVLSMAFAGIAGDLLGARTVFVLCAGVIGGGALIALALFRRSTTPAVQDSALMKASSRAASSSTSR
jgi:MFS family permease